MINTRSRQLSETTKRQETAGPPVDPAHIWIKPGSAYDVYHASDAFEAALAWLACGEIDTLLCYMLDRSSRKSWPLAPHRLGEWRLAPSRRDRGIRAMNVRHQNNSVDLPFTRYKSDWTDPDAPLFPSERQIGGIHTRVGDEALRVGFAHAVQMWLPTWADRLTPHGLRHFVPRRCICRGGLEGPSGAVGPRLVVHDDPLHPCS